MRGRAGSITTDSTMPSRNYEMEDPVRLPLVFAVTGAALLAAAPVLAQPIGIGTSPQGTLTYQLGATYAKALSDAAQIQARVQPSSGTGVMVPLVNSGELDMGFVNTLELTEAFTGTGTFKDRPQKNLRTVGVMFPIKVGYFVKADSPIKSIKDLKGRTIAYGYTSQEIIKTLADAHLANGGMTVADVKTVLVPNLIRNVDEFVAGRVDAAFFALGSAKVSEADAAVGGIRFLPMVDAPAAIEGMRKVASVTYLDTVEPAPNLPGVKEPLRLMHYDYVMFASAELKADRVQKLTQVLAEQKAAMGESMALFKSLKVDRLYRDVSVPYHDGAIAYYKAKNIPLTK